MRSKVSWRAASARWRGPFSGQPTKATRPPSKSQGFDMSPNGKAQDIEAAAAAWFERREWSDWDAAAQERLEAWLSESTAHRIAFVRLEAAWEQAERLKALGAGIPPGQVPARATFGLAPEIPS